MLKITNAFEFVLALAISVLVVPFLLLMAYMLFWTHFKVFAALLGLMSVAMGIYLINRANLLRVGLKIENGAKRNIWAVYFSIGWRFLLASYLIYEVIRMMVLIAIKVFKF